MSNVIPFSLTPATDQEADDWADRALLCGLEYCDELALPDVGLIAEGVEPGDKTVPAAVRLISVQLCGRCATALGVPGGGAS